MAARDPKALQRAFGQVLRQRRGPLKLSQEELADRADLHRTYVGQLERGLKSPSLKSIEAIAHALGVRPHALIKEAEAWAEAAATRVVRGAKPRKKAP